MNDLVIQRLTKTYQSRSDVRKFSIQSIDLQVREGECFAILGPSGCGKTTLLKCIAGLLTPDEGTVILGKEDITVLPTEKRGLGMVFQQPLLFPHMTVIDNTAFGLKMIGWRKKERRAAAEQVLASVGLSGYDRRYPNELSGGQQQRVALARAIVTRPRLLLLDEPFSSLDPCIRSEMHRLVKQIHQQYQSTLLFVTHDREEAFELADRIAVMHDGTIQQIGTPLELYTRPSSRFVAQFIGSGNLVEGHLKNGLFQSGNLQVEVPELVTEGPGWLMIRPEQFEFVSSQADRLLEGEVMDVKLRKGHYVVEVNANGLTIEVLHRLKKDKICKPGDRVSLSFDTNQLHFIPKLEG